MCQTEVVEKIKTPFYVQYNFLIIYSFFGQCGRIWSNQTGRGGNVYTMENAQCMLEA